jgi:riboflavin biosynthesis pyrimidine reductase
MPLFNDPEKSCHYIIKKIQKFEPNGLIINYIPDKKPIRPYIICHILTSIDGKATGKFLGDKKIEHLVDEYYRIHFEFKANGFACGKTTFLEGFVKDNSIDLSKFKDAKVDKNEDYIYEKLSECKFFAVCFDRKGSINWKSNSLKDDLPGYNNAHIIQVMTENVKDEYLAHLKSIGVSYIICGKDDINIDVCLEKLRLKFGIKVLLLEGGSLINGSFNKAGVIDEISLVQVPMSAEKDDKPLFYEGNIQSYTLETVKPLKNGVYMLYRHKANI